MINKSNLTIFPKLKTETNFYDQKSILKRHNLPINVYKSLTPNKIKQFKIIFSSLSKKKLKQIKNNTISNFINKENSNIINKEDNTNKKYRKNSIINTEIELKMNKIMGLFNIDKKPKKNAEYDLIKGRMFNKLKNNLVLKVQNYNNTFESNDDYSTIQKQKEFLQKKKYNLLSKKKINIITDSIPKLFNTERITRRFEDLYMTPEEFLNKNFTKEEIEIMIKNANYFKLNKEPLKEWDLNINFTLKDSLDKEEKLSLKNKSHVKLKQNPNTNKKINHIQTPTPKNNNNINIIPKKDLSNDKYENVPKLNLKNITEMNNSNNNNTISTLTEENIKKPKKESGSLSINQKNKLLYINPYTSIGRHVKHVKIYNLTERNNNSRNFFKKTTFKIRNNSKHIQRFENKKSQKLEYAETQNILNEIKSNYMKKYHEKVTQDNIIKNKIKFYKHLQTNIKEKIKKSKKSNSKYVKIGNQDQILLSERLWKS